MTCYIANHRKKIEGLARKEATLRRLIEHAASREKLLKAATEVRDGRIQVLRVKQRQNPERTPEERAVFLNDENKINSLKLVTAESVLAEFMPT